MDPTASKTMSIWGCVCLQTKPKVLSHAFPRVPNGINVAVGSKQCSPLVAIIYRKWVGANLITIPSYVATVYPHVIKSHQKSDPNQARYRRMNWQCRHVGNLGTWVYHLSAGNSPTIYQFYMKLSPGYTDGIYIYIYL